MFDDLVSGAWWTPNEYELSSERPDSSSLIESLGDEDAWENLVDRLYSFRLLGDDWDGDGALAPRMEVVATAVGLIRGLKAGRFSPASHASVSPAGGIVIEWRSESEYIEAEIETPGLIEWMCMRPGLPTSHREQQLSLDRDARSSTTTEATKTTPPQTVASEMDQLVFLHGSG